MVSKLVALPQRLIFAVPVQVASKQCQTSKTSSLPPQLVGVPVVALPLFPMYVSPGRTGMQLPQSSPVRPATWPSWLSSVALSSIVSRCSARIASGAWAAVVRSTSGAGRTDPSIAGAVARSDGSELDARCGESDEERALTCLVSRRAGPAGLPVSTGGSNAAANAPTAPNPSSTCT